LLAHFLLRPSPTDGNTYCAQSFSSFVITTTTKYLFSFQLQKSFSLHLLSRLVGSPCFPESRREDGTGGLLVFLLFSHLSRESGPGGIGGKNTSLKILTVYLFFEKAFCHILLHLLLASVLRYWQVLPSTRFCRSVWARVPVEVVSDIIGLTAPSISCIHSFIHDESHETPQCLQGSETSRIEFKLPVLLQARKAVRLSVDVRPVLFCLF
jgi:hypothetical protein